MIKVLNIIIACVAINFGCSYDLISQETTSNTISAAKPITIVSWNVESGGSDPIVIASRLRELASVDIVCLSEVSPSVFVTYEEAAGSKFKAINSRTGRDDSLQILYDQECFEELQWGELSRYEDIVLNNGSHRSPLWVRLKDRASGDEFIVTNNHLARSNAEMRKQQAIGLREWARSQSVAQITIGDFNMDFDFPTERGNEAFNEMLRDNIWNWVRPSELIDTNWADHDKDGVDDYPDSMLDFAFVASVAKTWKTECRVIWQENDFPDDASTSDHRPIQLVVQP